MNKNQVDDDQNSYNDDVEDVDDDDQDYDSTLKDDILRPASTRSKIVVNLREPADPKRKGKQFGKNDPVIYDLDQYDKVRMQLILPDQKLYRAYQKTIDELQGDIKLQPRKTQMPFIPSFFLFLVEYSFLAGFFYVFFLIIQLALFNLVILGIVIVFCMKLYNFFEAIKEKIKFNHRTAKFKKFIEQQNETVYKDMGIEIQPEREGCWLEFLLIHDEEMFEQKIA